MAMVEFTMKFVAVVPDDGELAPTDQASLIAYEINDMVGGAFEEIIGDNLPQNVRILTKAEEAEILKDLK